MKRSTEKYKWLCEVKTINSCEKERNCRRGGLLHRISGYAAGQKMEKNIKFDQSTPLWDNSLSLEERLDYLTGALTLEEKIHCLTTGCPDIPRLGIRATYMGGEAAHGIEARHDQAFNKGEPEPTTAFTQPIGMSASFDRELIRECGRAVGEEARALYTRNGGGGLCRRRLIWSVIQDGEELKNLMAKIHI